MCFDDGKRNIFCPLGEKSAAPMHKPRRRFRIARNGKPAQIWAGGYLANACVRRFK